MAIYVNGRDQERHYDPFEDLDAILTLLGTTNTFFWPFLESTGIDVQSYGEEDAPLISGEAGTNVELNDPATGWAPFKHLGGVHSYHFEGADDQHLHGGDAAKLSFNGTTDAAFSVGCFFYAEAATGTLISKYDAAGTAREWRLHLLAGPDLGLELFQDIILDSETAQTTTALSLRQWYSGVITYGGAGGDGGGGAEKQAANDMIIYIDGVAVTATVSEVGGAYVDMVGGATGVMIGANDDNAAPANEFTGRMGLPILCGKQMSAVNVAEYHARGKRLLGLD
ncbi:hypothetical protein LCGC14_2385580 [marine sediment metagenome]|uniref:LamG-like jellyroll fold domain-containing protein n=1 Tax=marine sediment metagenome TaxID=412755 RepID=A0A0F9BZP1_9ZZZZ